MVQFLNKPLNEISVWKVIAEHHFRMPDEHLLDFINAIENDNLS